jgi:hypothetical protein
VSADGGISKNLTSVKVIQSQVFAVVVHNHVLEDIKEFGLEPSNKKHVGTCAANELRQK